ncbi:MAG: N-acetylmuramoyl-L-alanine amidase [Anaerolineae bacterium]|nr:N-acetylmuramoyl-L-alanine amidase [Anaerolineae bacterium]
MLQRRGGLIVLNLILFLSVSVLNVAATDVVLLPPPPDLARQATDLLITSSQVMWPVHSVVSEDDVLTVCVEVAPEELRAGDGTGVEWVEEAVRVSLTSLDWRVLHVLAEGEDGKCYPLSDFMPDEWVMDDESRITNDELPSYASVTPSPHYPVTLSSFPASLSGKTVYISAGHGWQWGKDYSDSYLARWATQRVVYQSFIEDHNNAEAVDQYLIPYLENAGATVIPLRERDWNDQRVIVDNDDGAPGYMETGDWGTGGVGYQTGTYRQVGAVVGGATAAATWVLDVPQLSEYALYAWVQPVANGVTDAHYRVQHAGGLADVWLDQKFSRATWRYLGTFPCYAGPVTVTLDNSSTEEGVVVADALRLGGGLFDDLAGIETVASFAPDKPWWEVATRYYANWMGLDPDEFSYFNDIVGRPMFARWNQIANTGADAVYISWHTNGYNGTAQGTESYVHNGSTYPRTAGSLELQQVVHNELIHDIRVGWDSEWIDRGKKQANLGEVRMLWDDNAAARMPGVLLEMAFHDHQDDADALKAPRFNRLAARAIYQGIVAYFEAQDGVDLVTLPEPPTHLRVQNMGGGVVQVMWEPSPVDAGGLGGEAATGYRLYTSPDGFAWGAPVPVADTQYALTGLAAGETVYVRVTAVNDGGESFPTEVLGARVGDVAQLLIVNGFDKLENVGLVTEVDPTMGENLRMWVDQMNDRDYVAHHGQAVPLSYVWDSASNKAVIAGRVMPENYTLVDWVLGEESTDDDGTLNAAERAALEALLAQDGALFISGSELAWELESVGSAPAFLNQQLHTDYVADDADTYTVAAVAGGVFEGLADFSFDAPEEYDADYPDVIAPLEGAAALTYVGGTGGTAAVQYADGCKRLLVLGFPFEVVRPEARPEVMARALDFLDACTLVTVRILSPQAGSIYSRTPAFAGTAAGVDLARVEVQVQAENGAFWDGAAWGVGAWLTATGTFSWTYPLPVLADGEYTLTAWAATSHLTSQPAGVVFTLDATPPLTTTIITPTGSVTLMLPTLQWEAPPDTGTPLVYQVEIAGTLHQTLDRFSDLSGTFLLLPNLSSDTYIWHVRALDVAGNIGPWSEWAMFEVIPSSMSRVYLPVILRNVTTTEPFPECILLLDSGFESAEEGWTFNNLAERVTDVVYEGTWAARVGIPPGAPGQYTYSSIARSLSLPADIQTVAVSLHLYPDAEDDMGDVYYATLVELEGERHTLPLSLSPADAPLWVTRTLDLSLWPEQTVSLYLGVFNDGDNDTAALYIDAVQVEACR